VYRHAIACEQVAINPTVGLNLPAVRGRRDRIATPNGTAALLDELPDQDRALWATFLYAGLRRGEARALRWEDVDLTDRVIRVERSWDPIEGEIEPKSHAGKRTVPINGTLAKLLAEHKLRSRRTDALVFGRPDGCSPFNPKSIQNRAGRAWEAAGLDGLTPHEARHYADGWVMRPVRSFGLVRAVPAVILSA
jgi:integrase